MTVTVTRDPLSARPWLGFGVEADPWNYHLAGVDAAGQARVNELTERRLRALRPGVARLFTNVAWWNPELDGDPAHYRWDHPELGDVVRVLRLLEDIGARSNLVLFQPWRVPTAQLPALARAMVALVAHLRDREGLRGIRWLTLFNEPESFFPHDSPLVRTIWGDACLTRGHTWADYVALNRQTAIWLAEAGLASAVQLVVPDSAWGGQMRRERVELAAAAFADLDVMYAYHHYNPEYRAFYAECPPAFAYAGAGPEARHFRKLLGPTRPLGVWEFNNCGYGFHTHFAGVGQHGEDVLGSLDCGPELVYKVFAAANHGVDLVALWHLHDTAENKFGLWRWRDQGWFPRPYYHYYAALCRAFRPGARLLRTRGARAPVSVLAAMGEGGPLTVALGNQGATARRVRVALPAPATAGRLLRLYPERLPTHADLPLTDDEPLAAPAATLDLRLAPRELAVWSHG